MIFPPSQPLHPVDKDLHRDFITGHGSSHELQMADRIPAVCTFRRDTSTTYEGMNSRWLGTRAIEFGGALLNSTA